VHHVGIFSMT